MKKIITDYAAYNLWADTQFADYFEKMDDSLFTQHVHNSFPSLQKTVLHIWGVEHVWLERMKGHLPTTFISDGFLGDKQTLLENWKSVSKHILDFVSAQDEYYFDSKIQIISHLSGKFEETAFNYAMHTFNHSTMHRGQLITMCRALNIEGALPSTDMLFYKRLLKTE